MQTECSAEPMLFARLDRRELVADFGGGAITSDAGALLLGATDRAIRLVDRFAACFADGRAAARMVHEVATLVGQRVFGIALGYEDLIDHDELRRDPVLGAVLGRLKAKWPAWRRSPARAHSTGWSMRPRPRIATAASATTRGRSRICSSISSWRPTTRPRLQITLDLDATDDPIHGHQEGLVPTATTTATATCRFTSSAATISWRRSCGAPTSTPAPGRSRKSRASSPGSAPPGRR